MGSYPVDIRATRIPATRLTANLEDWEMRKSLTGWVGRKPEVGSSPTC